MRYYEYRVFRASPRPVRAAIFAMRNLARRSIYAWAGVQKIRRDLQAMEALGRAELQAHQDALLTRLVTHAARAVPYYRDLFRERGIDPAEVRSVADLSRIPCLDKAAVRAEGERLLSQRPGAKILREYTSGSTGSPLTVFRDLESICWEEARLSRWRRRAGVLPGEPRVVIRGDQFLLARERADAPWLHDPLSNLLLVSSYHLDDEVMPAIIGRMREFSPVALEGYPGALLLLARFLDRTGATLPVRAVFTSSEQVYESHRALMRRAFAADVFDQYGMAERVALASECRAHRMHVDMDCAILEILRPDGSPCLPGETGEVVGTNLTNLAMPLIRYRTRDVASFGTGECSCGLDRPFLGELEGREADFVVGANGRRYPPATLTFPFGAADGVAESQIIQHRSGSLLVRLVPAPGVLDSELAAAQSRIVRGLHERLGEGMSIALEIVPAIAKGPNGKHRWVVSSENPEGDLPTRPQVS